MSALYISFPFVVIDPTEIRLLAFRLVIHASARAVVYHVAILKNTILAIVKIFF